MITTTLRKIRDAKPCQDGWKKLYKHLGEIKAYGFDIPITFQQIIESNGIDDALWCLRTVPEHELLWRHFAVDCAEHVKHLINDERSIRALDVARRYALGQSSNQEVETAKAAARAAARAAAKAAAKAAAWDAARAAAWDAARAAAWAAAWDAAWDAAAAAAWDAEKDWQARRLIELIEAGHWSPVVQQN